MTKTEKERIAALNRQMDLILKGKRCLLCGKMFKPKHHQKMYCSKKCTEKGYGKRGLKYYYKYKKKKGAIPNRRGQRHTKASSGLSGSNIKDTTFLPTKTIRAIVKDLKKFSTPLDK